MIEMFKEIETRRSGIIYKSTLDQIKKLYEADPELAGELAISAIELVLTGEISSDDMMISLMLEPAKAVNENNQAKYDTKVETAKVKKMVDMKLDKIAELANMGKKQREIGEILGLSQQIVSYRMGLIKTNYPELLDGTAANENSTKIQKNSTKIQTTLQNTKTEIFVKEEEKDEPVVPPKKSYFDF
jgi:hypothetical protein